MDTICVALEPCRHKLGIMLKFVGVPLCVIAHRNSEYAGPKQEVDYFCQISSQNASLEALLPELREGIRGWDNIGKMAEMVAPLEQQLGVWQHLAR